jgi:hypothetical protein
VHRKRIALGEIDDAEAEAHRGHGRAGPRHQVLGAPAADVEQQGTPVQRPTQAMQDAGEREGGFFLSGDHTDAFTGGLLEHGDELGLIRRFTDGARRDDTDPFRAGGASASHVLHHERRRALRGPRAKAAGGGQSLAKACDALIALDDSPVHAARARVGHQQVHGVASEIDGGQAHGPLNIRTPRRLRRRGVRRIGRRVCRYFFCSERI